MSEYSVEEILQAKRIAKEAGYNVTLPTDRLEQAKNIAQANGYNVRKMDPTEMAMQVAKDAGYQVLPPDTNPNPARTTPTPAPKQDIPPKQEQPAQPQQKEDPYAGYSWSERQAAKYL